MKAVHTCSFSIAVLVFAPIFALAQQSSFGLELAPENRCSDYDRALYPYRQPLLLTVAFDHRSGSYDIYTGEIFTQDVDLTIEHIVSLAEAHDSGLCAAGPETRQRFASDPLNLTLTPRRINSGKSDRDLAEWLPRYNRCWYVNRSLEIRRKYGLTIDELELAAADEVLSNCSSLALTLPPPPAPFDLSIWDSDGNGRITCPEAKEQGVPVVVFEHPAYPYMDDRDGDGKVCE